MVLLISAVREKVVCRSVEGLDTIRTKYSDIITDIRIPKTGQEKSRVTKEKDLLLCDIRTQVVESALKDIVETVKVVLS